MREYLTNRLQSRMGDRVAEFNPRAYAWYADEGLWTQAVQHAIAAKDFDRAFEFVGQCAMSLVTKGDLLTLLAWERQLPATVMTGQREVKLALAWGMALVTRFKEAERLLVHSSKRQTPIREAICGGDAALPAPFTMRLGMIAHAGATCLGMSGRTPLRSVQLQCTLQCRPIRSPEGG